MLDQRVFIALTAFIAILIGQGVARTLDAGTSVDDGVYAPRSLFVARLEHVQRIIQLAVNTTALTTVVRKKMYVVLRAAALETVESVVQRKIAKANYAAKKDLRERLPNNLKTLVLKIQITAF